MLFSKIPRVRLLNKETPITKAVNLAEHLGHKEVYFKRDDVMELGMAGNKVRSLEFWLGEAIAKSSTTILVAGLPESNLCRLSAAACAKLKLKCIIVHNGEKPESFHERAGNPLLNHLLGTEAIYLGNVDEFERTRYVKEYAAALRKSGEIPYIIGDQVVGALGYVNAALELVHQAEQSNIDIHDVFISASGGPTAVGLLYGLALFGKSFKLHLISAEYKKEVFYAIQEEIFDGLCRKLDLTPAAHLSDISVFYDDFLGEGYAKPTEDSISAAYLLAQKEGIFIEQTYNSKALNGMINLIKDGKTSKDQAVCCYITGGGPALFGHVRHFEKR